MQVWHLVVLHVWSLTCFVLYVLFLKITASVSIDTALSPVRSTSCAYVQHVSRFKSFLGNIATITNPFLCSESSPLRHGFHMNEIIGCQWQWASGIVHFHLRIWGVRMRMCGFWSEKNQYESMEVSCLYCFQTSASCENQAVGCGRLFVSEKECGSGWRTHAGDGRRHRDPKGNGFHDLETSVELAFPEVCVRLKLSWGTAFEWFTTKIEPEPSQMQQKTSTS